MDSFVHLKEFESTTQSWTSYTEQLEQIFIASGIDQADCKRNFFFTFVVPTKYALIQNFLSSAVPTVQTFEEIIDILNLHFDPESAYSMIVKR